MWQRALGYELKLQVQNIMHRVELVTILGRVGASWPSAQSSGVMRGQRMGIDWKGSVSYMVKLSGICISVTGSVALIPFGWCWMGRKPSSKPQRNYQIAYFAVKLPQPATPIFFFRIRIRKSTVRIVQSILRAINVFHMRAGHTSELGTPKHIVKAINYDI